MTHQGICIDTEEKEKMKGKCHLCSRYFTKLESHLKKYHPGRYKAFMNIPFK